MESSNYLWNNEKFINSTPLTFVFDSFTGKKKIVKISDSSLENCRTPSKIIKKGTYIKYKKYFSIDNINNNEKSDDSKHEILSNSFQMRKKSEQFVENMSSQWSVLSSCNDASFMPSFHITEVTATPLNLSQQKILNYKPNVKPLPDHSQLWNNPVFGVDHQANIPSVANSKRLLSRKSFDIVNNTFSFSKTMLERVVVLGQVDDKFISCVFSSKDEGDVLVLIDQHAVHERIRLEKLLNQTGYYKNDEDKVHLKSLFTRLLPPAHVCFSESEIDLVRHYQKELKELGLVFSISSLQKSSHSIVLRSIPCMFVNVCEYQPEAKGSVINSGLVKDFIMEQIQVISTTHGKCSLSSSTLYKAMASYACHGAIKFGDKLSLKTCQNLMKELSQCDLPFQCAHGRPSVAPLFKLNQLKYLDKSYNHKGLNFSKLRINK
uniref:DNA mismatch repair protein Mlh3 n=1 Tax=Hydra vulgaris TaxID=6087 RepID=T2M389_HYDVU